jgi:cation diffusion facilitator CzcD-associated flavoprotein CzcO
VQFIPEIAPLSERLLVFQRSANWIFRKPNRDYTRLEQWLGARFPLLLRLYRLRVWLFGELLIYPLMRNRKWAQGRARRHTLEFIEEQIDDPELRRKLVPDYPIGAKRVLFTNNYYEALNRDDVLLITTPIERIAPRGVVTQDGVLHELDAIVLATGFQTNDFLAPIKITGRGGVALDDVWKEGAEAYLGISVSGFPNLFLMYGPNTNLGHNSIIVMIECQARYIVSCIRELERRGLRWLDVKAPLQRRYNEALQRRLREMAWTGVADSWYLREGKVTNNWPGRTTEYWWRTRRPDLGAYELGSASC